MPRSPLPPECAGCPWAEKNWGFCPPDPITENTKLVVIGRDPGEHEVRLGRGFVGPAGRKLRQAEKMAGLRTGWVEMQYGQPIAVREPRGGSEVAHVNVRLCRPPRNAWEGYQPAQECWKRLLRRHLEKWTGPVLVTGLEALAAFADIVGFDAATGRYAARGSLFPVLAERGWIDWCFFTLHPSFIARGGGAGEETKSQSHFLPLLATDIRRALESPGHPPLPEVLPAPPVPELLARWRDAGRPSPIAIDVEEDEVIGVSWDGETVWEIPWSDENARAVAGFWREGGMPAFHYASYDLDQLCRRAGAPLPERWYDTIVMGAAVNATVPLNLASLVLTHVPDTTAWKGLVDVAKTGGNDVLWRMEQQRRVWTALLEGFDRPVPASEEEWERLYNGLDVAWTWHLVGALEAEMGEGVQRYWREFLLPLQRPLLEMGWRGIPARAEAFARLREEIDRQIQEAQQTVDQAAAHLFDDELKEAEFRVRILEEEREEERRRVGKRAKFSRAAELSRARTALNALRKRIEGGFNLKSNPQRRQLLRHYLGIEGIRVKGRKGLSTGEQAIDAIILRLEGGRLKPKIGTKEEVLEILRAMNAGSKLRTLAANFLATEPDEDGRVRTLYHLHRTDTGRLSSGFTVDDADKAVKVSKSAMQLQNMPRFVRQAFQAEPGYVFVGGDWAAIEWCLAMLDAGTLLNDPPGFHLDLLERFFRQELDPHRYLASFVFNKPEEEITREERKTAKGVTFGWLFGGTHAGLAKTLGMPVPIVARACAAHDEAFKLARWREHVAERFGREHRVVTMGGWQRWFWDPFIKDPATGKVVSPKPTELCNTRIQGSAADLMKWTLRRLFEEAPEWVEVVTTTHDSFMLQVPEERGEEGAAWLKEKMEAPIPWLGNRRFRAEVRTGRTWADV